LALGAPRPNPAAPVITTAPFGTARPARPGRGQVGGQISGFRPMVFQPFDGPGKIVSVGEPEIPGDDNETVDRLPDANVAEAEQAPPPLDFEALKAAAWTEGFQQGYDEGLKLAAQEQQDTITRLSALLHDVAADNEEMVRGLETQVVELALAVAEKVIAREAAVDPQIVLNVVRSALSEIHDATELRIHVSPEDMPLLEQRWQEMLPRSVAAHSELLSDELVERGGVIVETRIGYVDSQLKTRINPVVTSFQAVLDGEPT
jgi:flagellar biosynthesis/type III secretory pathway protein FliH